MIHASNFRRQKGQTIALVAISLVSFVAIGALAIDLTSLYSARSEIQRAADAVALAGAKAFVDSGVTTDSDPANSNRQTLANTLATAYANTALGQNLVAGAAPQLVGTTIDLTTHPGNPTITVQLQQTNLPLFFSRMFGRTSASVSATAVAEAYNPSFSQSNTGGSFVPSAPKCVKPILLPNSSPNRNGVTGNPPFVILATGQVNPAFAKQFVGLGPFDEGPPQCNLSNPGCTLQAGDYLPMQLANAHQYCPSCAGGTDYERSIECCDGGVFNAPQCGNGASATWALSQALASQSTAGLKCLIHETGGTTPDSFDDANAFQSGNGLLIDPGSFSQTRYGLHPNDLIATSDSIITVPVFDQTKFSPHNPQVNIVGFLTLFVRHTNGGAGRFSANILNVAGCGNGKVTAPPVSGGGVSSIPVRLIHN